MSSRITEEVPQFHELMVPTLDAIRALGGSASIHEITSQVIETMALPTQVTQIPHGKGSQTELEYRMAWARTYLKKVDLLENSARGVWSLTSLGRNNREIEPKNVVKDVRQQRHEEKEQSSSPAATGEIPNESETDSNSWREDLLGVLQTMAPDAFERLCQRILRESGFIEVEVTGKSGDGGIDGFGMIRLAGLISFPVYFQCKRYSGSISAKVVRDFRGAMVGRADKGVILTTATFTRDAQKEASRDGTPPIDLIDGELLMDLLKELKLGVSTREVEVVDVSAGFFKDI